MVRRSLNLSALWVSVDVGKGISSEFVGGAMVLLMTYGCLRMIWSMHPIYYSISYSYVSEAALPMLVFFCFSSFINCLLFVNVGSILVWGSCKGLMFWELESMWVGHMPY